LLFVGVSVSSAISIDMKSNISNNKIEEWRSCSEVSKSDFIKVEMLQDRIEFYSRLLFLLSKYTPEIENLYNDYQNFIESNEPNFICEILEQIMIYLYEKHEFYVNMFYYYENGNFIIFGIYYLIDFPFRLLVVYFGVLHEISCTNPPWP
jgi:hypothetical protein